MPRLLRRLKFSFKRLLQGALFCCDESPSSPEAGRREKALLLALSVICLLLLLNLMRVAGVLGWAGGAGRMGATLKERKGEFTELKAACSSLKKAFDCKKNLHKI